MPVRARNIRGNLVFYDTNPLRLIEAWGNDVITFFDDFIHSPVSSDAVPGYTVTLVEAGAESTITNPDGSGGQLLFTTAGNEDDGVTMTKIGESFGFAATNFATYFGCRLKISDATQSDFLIGLCISDTDLLAGITDGVYFEKLDGGTGISFTTEKDSTETQTDLLHTAVADTFVTLEFYGTGASVSALINGIVVATHTTNICNDELLTPSLEFLAGSAAARTMSLDWWRAIQIGR